MYNGPILEVRPHSRELFFSLRNPLDPDPDQPITIGGLVDVFRNTVRG